MLKLVGALISFVIIIAFFILINYSNENTYFVKNNTNTKKMFTQYLDYKNSMNLKNFPLENISCFTIHSPRETIKKNEENLITPASVQKLFTVEALEKILSEKNISVNDTIKTKFYFEPQSNSLYIEGGYDPFIMNQPYIDILNTNERLVGFKHTSFESIVNQLQQKSLPQISQIVVLGNNNYMRQGWTKAETSFVGVPKAISINQGIDELPRGKLSENPTVTFTNELANALNLGNIGVTEVNPEQFAIEKKLILEIQSISYKEIISQMLIQSDNYSAEMMLDLSLNLAQEPNIDSLFKKYSINSGGVAVDGSGLSPGNKATCDNVFDSLNVLEDNLDSAPKNYLSISGVNGTLMNRYAKELKGSVIAKTGSIKNVSSLAGYFTLSGDSSTTFVALINRENPEPNELAKKQVDSLIQYLREQQINEKQITKLEETYV
jgi:D-alanyl-D-alanine carboxypeptidase